MDWIGPGGGCLTGWLLFGICGYVGRRIIVLPPRPVLPPSPIVPPRPEPGPDPGPDTLGWLVGAVIGLVAGAVVGYYFHQAFAVDDADSAGVLLTFIGAFVGGRIAADVVGRFVPRFAA
jgi:uncharacterized membrane protein YeaQ/YmgE (transglycosylase-associated protein family)